jgi:ABC-type antimicrobial peptide transport system ATPase subunit
LTDNPIRYCLGETNSGTEGRIHMIIKSGEIRIVPEAESSIDMNIFPDDEDLVKIDREQQAYKSQHRQILEKHAGNYIAMHQGEIVDYYDHSTKNSFSHSTSSCKTSNFV